MELCGKCKKYGKCGRFYSSLSNYAETCKDYDKIKPTHYEKLTADITELAKFINDVAVVNCERFCAYTKNGKCTKTDNDGRGSCIDGIVEYLKSEVAE